MLWAIFAISTALIIGVRRFQEKEFFIKTDFRPMTVAWATRLIAAVILLILAYYVTGLKLPSSLSFWIPLGVVVFAFYPICGYCLYGALKEGDLSKTVPVLSFTPVFSLLLAWLFLGEEPGFKGVFGIYLVAFSMYMLHAHRHEKLWQPFIDMIRHRPTRLMAIVSLCFAIAAMLDRIAIHEGGPYIYAALNVSGAVLAMGFLDRLMTRTKVLPLWVKHWKFFLMTGVLDAANFIFYTLSMSLAPFTSYVIAIRDLSIFVSASLGIVVIKERVTGGTILSYALAIAGMGFILL